MRVKCWWKGKVGWKCVTRSNQRKFVLSPPARQCYVALIVVGRKNARSVRDRPHAAVLDLERQKETPVHHLDLSVVTRVVKGMLQASKYPPSDSIIQTRHAIKKASKRMPPFMANNCCSSWNKSNTRLRTLCQRTICQSVVRHPTTQKQNRVHMLSTPDRPPYGRSTRFF